MPLFDTSALVPLFFTDHEHHPEAQLAFRDAEQVILHPNVIAEFTTVMRRVLKDLGEDGNQGARQALKALLAEPRVEIRSELRYEAAVDRYLSESTISFSDAVLCEAQRSMEGGPLITFDANLARTSRSHQQAGSENQ